MTLILLIILVIVIAAVAVYLMKAKPTTGPDVTTSTRPVSPPATQPTKTTIKSNPIEDSPVLGNTATDPSVTGAPSGSTTVPADRPAPSPGTGTTMQPGPGAQPRTTPPTTPPPAAPKATDPGSKPDKQGSGNAELSSGGQG